MYIQCGMRHPSTLKKEGDLSRLTSSSSSTTTAVGNGNGSFYIPDFEITRSGSTTIIGGATSAHTTQHNNSSNTTNSNAAITTNATAHSSSVNNIGCTTTITSTTTTNINNNEGFNNNNSNNNINNNNSTYSTTEILYPYEWSQLSSRKRKERQDSTSSTTQERKLIRSNSVELIPTPKIDGGEVIRRVSSHEEFKRPLKDKTNNKIFLVPVTSEELLQLECHRNPLNHNNQQHHHHHHHQQHHHRRRRPEVSPVRTRTFDFSYKCRISPYRDNVNSSTGGGGGNGGGGGGNNCNNALVIGSVVGNKKGSSTKINLDYAEGEHERRRNSERFCKARAQKTQYTKKSTKYLAQRLRGGRSNDIGDNNFATTEIDENVYKYDMVHTKNERRGFISSSGCNGKQVLGIIGSGGGGGGDDLRHLKHRDDGIISDTNSDHTLIEIHPNKSPKCKKKSSEIQPWDVSFQDDTPVVCPRFADLTYDQSLVANLPRIQNSSIITDDTTSSLTSVGKNTVAMAAEIITDPVDIIVHSGLMKTALGHFTQSENMKTRDVMQNIQMGAKAFAGPDEKLKQTNRKILALKKKITLFEEHFLRQHGYRPSQAEKQNDASMKNVLAEIHKLRKEKQQLKSDPSAVMMQQLNVKGIHCNLANRADKMKEVVLEIQKRIQDKRAEGNRTQPLNQLSVEQLAQEKASVQRCLLYFESLFGRPSSKEDREIAHPLYDCYRQVKRALKGSKPPSAPAFGGGVSELPTIQEHETFDMPRTERSGSIDLHSQLTIVSSTGDSSIGEFISPESPTYEAPIEYSRLKPLSLKKIPNLPVMSSYHYYQKKSKSLHRSPSPPTPETPCTPIPTPPPLLPLPSSGQLASQSLQQQQQSSTQSQSSSSSSSLSAKYGLELQDLGMPVPSSLYGQKIHELSLDELWKFLEMARIEKIEHRKIINDFEQNFEIKHGRKMLKADRSISDQTVFALYKQKKAKLKLLEALVKKHMAK